jgi:hypothetical protein
MYPVCIQVRSEGRHCLIARLVNEGDPITWVPPHVINDTYHTFSHVCAPTKVRLQPSLLCLTLRPQSQPQPQPRVQPHPEPTNPTPTLTPT